MTDEPEDADAVKAQPDPEPDWVRRRRLAEVFGDVLPEVTRDDRPDDESGDSADAESRTDAWLRRQVPPHHG